MNLKIVIVGSTGKLGTKLLRFTKKNSISLSCITCYKNSKKIIQQKFSNKIKNHFILSSYNDQKKFFKYLEQKINFVHPQHFQEPPKPPRMLPLRHEKPNEKWCTQEIGRSLCPEGYCHQRKTLRF